jgi:hypothetical protein
MGHSGNENQPSGWFFYAFKIFGAAQQPKILKKKKISDDWQVSKPPCKKIYTELAEFSPQFGFFLSV